MHLMPLSVWEKPPACVYWVADVIGDTPLLRWKVKYYKALCVLTILLQIGSRNICLHNCHFQITNIATCYVCTVLLSSLRWKFGGGMIIWNYVVGRLNDIHSIWTALYLYRYLIQKNKFIEFSRHVYLWIQRFLMKQIPNKNESHAFEFTKKVV